MLGDLATFCDLIDKIYSKELCLDDEFRRILVNNLQQYREKDKSPAVKAAMMQVIKACPEFAFDLIQKGMVSGARTAIERKQAGGLVVTCSGEQCHKRGKKDICIDCIRRISLPRDWFDTPETK